MTIVSFFFKGHQKSFHKMTEQSREKFMEAVFGKDGNKKIETSTAAALLAATVSAGDPQIAENIAELLVPQMGESVDQAMMAALMTGASMLNAGASVEEVRKLVNLLSFFDPPAEYLAIILMRAARSFVRPFVRPSIRKTKQQIMGPGV